MDYLNEQILVLINDSKHADLHETASSDSSPTCSGFISAASPPPSPKADM